MNQLYSEEWLMKDYAMMVVIHDRDTVEHRPFSEDERLRIKIITDKAGEYVSLKMYDEALLLLRAV